MRFRNTDGGHNERDIGIFGGCTSLRRLQGIDIATGDMVLQIRTPSMYVVEQHRGEGLFRIKRFDFEH